MTLRFELKTGGGGVAAGALTVVRFSSGDACDLVLSRRCSTSEGCLFGALAPKKAISWGGLFFHKSHTVGRLFSVLLPFWLLLFLFFMVLPPIFCFCSFSS